MIEPDYDGVQQLKKLYAKENLTSNFVRYDQFEFSLNRGDYIKPILDENHISDEEKYQPVNV